MSDCDSVRVAIRIRPMVKSESDRGCQEVVSRVADTPQVNVNRIESYTFNYVFGVHDTQEQVYTEAVSEMLNKLFAGFNVTILAYGQTGSGKTHTMGTAFDGEMGEHVGVIPRAMNDIFARIEQLADEYNFGVTCSFMELYQELLIDLLSSRPRDLSVLEIRENATGIIIPNLTELTVRSARETTDCLVQGSSGRAVASTAMNKQSSRSHAIFTVTIEATSKDDRKVVTTSKFHLVDLAGSERSKKTKTTGDRFKEGVKINQGLLALGNVISTLGTGNSTSFVRYRDSKLTRLLQDSLGGNSITLMIACVSPADYNVDETLSTLRYADRARKIKNKPIVNQDPHEAELNRLNSIITKLRMEIFMLGGSMTGSLKAELQNVPAINEGGGGDSCDSAATLPAGYCKLCRQKPEKKNQNYQLQQQLQTTLHDMAECEMRAHIAEATHDNLKAKTERMRNVVLDLQRDVEANADREHLLKHVNEIIGVVENIDEEMERSCSEMKEHHQGGLSASERVAGGDGVPDEEEQEQTEAYTSKQIDFKEQLQRINRELRLKEELHQRVAGNYDKFCLIDNNVEGRLQQYATKIQEMEAQKAELMDKLTHVNDTVSAKLAEERRKRLQTLEQELNDFKRRNIQQAKLLKVREKETQKIKNLNTEIQTMKQSKVKLIRAMRQESENFRQWKVTREKELTQLRNKDRKMMIEMARKEQMHTKQRNVLKRKCEEAMAVNKRLKDALDRQKVAQSLRQKTSKEGGSASSSAASWIERELEVIVSLIDAEHSLDQLMEDRGAISRRIAELKLAKRRSPPSDSIDALELSNFQEELEMRNAQIADLQQKVCLADLEKRMRSLSEAVHSIGEARTTIQHLVKSISEMRREYAKNLQDHKAALDEQMLRQQEVDSFHATATRSMRQMKSDYEQKLADLERTSEEKVAVLLRTIYNRPQPVTDETNDVPDADHLERMKIQEEQLNRMDKLREELDYYKDMVTNLQRVVEQKRANKRTEPKVAIENTDEAVDVGLSSEEDESPNNSSIDDPDWKETPRIRRKRSNAHNRTRNTSANSSQNDETFTTAVSSNGVSAASAGSSASSTGNSQLKRKSKGCSCRGNCVNKRCGCHSIAEKCSLKCRCSSDCVNGKPNARTDATDGDDGKAVAAEVTEQENILGVSSEFDVNETKSNSQVTSVQAQRLTYHVPNETFLTPKVARLSQLTFAKKSSKTKFFD